MSQRRLRLSCIGGELLVVAGHGNGASVWAQRLGHAIGTPVVRGQHGRVAVASAVGRVWEVWGRAVRAHRDAGGHAAGVPRDDLLGCWVSCRLGRAVLAQSPGAHIWLQIERLAIAHGVPGHVGHTRRSVGSPHPPPPPVVPLFKHVLKRGVQHPKVALPLPTGLLWHLDEALIERQIVSYTVLPPFRILLIVGELGHDVVVYSAQG